MKTKEEIREYKKEYYKKNREKLREYWKEYYKKNRTKRIECVKNYYKKNRTKIREYKIEYWKEYYKKNKERISKARKEKRHRAFLDKNLEELKPYIDETIDVFKRLKEK